MVATLCLDLQPCEVCISIGTSTASVHDGTGA